MKTFSTVGLVIALTVVPAIAQKDNTPWTPYITAQEALAKDDLPAAKTAFTALAGTASGSLKDLATTAAQAADIKAARKAFRTLSDEMLKQPLPEGLATAFCPMFEKGSHWVQKKGSVANPYYGKSMLTCGEFK